MAISGVNPKCYILALFVRDDGMRFLLGDDPFEFKDNQLHFQQNTMANDVVEVQGNDGYLLAGQVRRPGTQVFDGYVCNGTNSKEDVEVKRRAFLQFFRRSHFYKVIYVFPNGTAIQRKQGFLVDDPTVQELYQQYPAYHVALNFEDVNYYTYEEDDQGHEIYAKEAIVPLARGGATGGLIWDSYGVVWEDAWSLPLSISGVQFQILNNAGARAPIDHVELYGDTYQQTYSGKNLLHGDYIGGLRQGVTSNWENTYVTFSGETTTSYVNLTQGNINMPISPGTYTFSTDKVSTQFTKSIRFNYDSTYHTFTIPKGGSSTTFTIPEGVTAPVLSIIFVSSVSSGMQISDSFGVMLESGSTPTSYEPYVGGTASPNPNYTQAVQVVTGEQTVTVSDGVDSEEFHISLGSIELCKIGNYRDKIFNNDPNEDWYDPDLEDNAWYVHKATNMFTVTSSLTGLGKSGTTSNNAFYYSQGFQDIDKTDMGVGASSTSVTSCFTSYFTSTSTYNLLNSSTIGVSFNKYSNNDNVDFRVGFGINSNINTLALFKTWLDANELKVYYPLASPTNTKITDATLVGQLEALGAMKLFIGENNVLVSAPTPNLPATLAFDYYSKFVTIGAEWEEGGTKGATIVNVDAIDNTYPVWELTGPATNPTLSVLTTNTALTYNGTITASQKLVIDMFNKTATLNGTSVIGNISGDFVYMAPGTNRLAYTASNTDAPDSTIYWQEVVG